ncbi:MAG: FAD:protein FMN transferase [Candidatus Riflebacteria bacterium]|nr:FAD:protein FMN transferase [Candidatus Riflebacteria bacterium]
MTGIRAKVLLVIAAITVAIMLLKSPRPAAPLFESRLMMDTIISLRAYPPVAREQIDGAFAEFASVENMASFHLEGSELSVLNRTGTLAETSSLTPLLRIAVDYYTKTDGYFDVSFASLQKAYGFYSGEGRLPAEDELTDLLRDRCGLSQVFRQSADGFELASGSLLDLGGIAGGYAIEKAARVLRESGCSGFLIDDAGDIWVEGGKPDNSPWRIAVRDPRDNGTLALVETRKPLAISTSGDYERFITVDGKRYGHIMNPHNGRPVDYYSSVTIIASEPVAADALSTAVFAMPPEIAFKWVEERNLAALFLTSTGTIHLSSAGRLYFSQVKTQ